MTGITQKVPNYIGGISQQPDELMPLGSVRDALNVIPDVTNGLSKRPGGRLLNPLTTVEEGTWFHIYRDKDEQYLGHILYNGTVMVYDLNNQGLPCKVDYSDKPHEIYPNSSSQDPDDDPINAYPSCDWAKVQTELYAWTDTDKQIKVLQEEVSSLIKEEEQEVPNKYEESFYEVQKVDYFGYKNHYVLYKGKVKGDGKNFENPESKDRPKNYKERYGERRVKNATVFDARTDKGPDSGREGSLTNNPYQRYDSPTTNADIYPVIWYEEGDEIDNSREIRQKREEIKQLKRLRKKQYQSYVQEVANCGGTPVPSDFGVFSPRNGETIDPVVPTYLKHQEDQGIETLTINDYTFFTNPDPFDENNGGKETTVSMIRIDSEVRPWENYIELNLLALNKEYTLYLTEGKDGGTVYDTRVTEIAVRGLNENEWEDDEASCPFIGTEEFLLTGNDLVKSGGGNNSNKTNLRIRLTTTGTQFLPKKKDGTDPNDYRCRYITNIDILSQGAGFRRGDEFQVQVSGKDYRIRVNEVEKYTVENINAIIRPAIVSGDGNSSIQAEQILNNIVAAIEAYDPTFTTKIIGNGVYVAREKSDTKPFFAFSTPEKQFMNVVTDQVNDISSLPVQCKEGYIVKIANTDSEYDDYYAEFQASVKGIDGKGSWEETREPGGYHRFNQSTMPHVMRRIDKQHFRISPVRWKSRKVGDDTTNPPPSFVGQKINKVVLFRNRLGMLSGENVILSKPGFFTNFWNGSALAQVDNDPIDISAASTQPAVLYDAIETGEGLLCFSQNQQHLLSTDSEVFGPNTARFNMVGTYRYSKDAHVFSFGRTVGFMNNSGLYSRALELTDIGRSKQSNVIELSKPVSNLMPANLNRVGDTQDNNFVMYSNKDSQNIWVYRYFDDDGERRQSAWFRWKIPGYLLYHFVIEDVYYTVSWSISDSPGVGKVISLQRYDLKDSLSTSLVEPNYTDGTDSPIAFQAHLDNYRIAFPTDLQYYEHLDQTYFQAPIVYYSDRRVVGYALSPNPVQAASGAEFELVGSAIEIKIEIDTFGTWFVLDGNWSKSRLMIGYEFDMKVEFPTIYPTKTTSTLTSRSTVTDTRSELLLQRIKLNFGNTGVYEVKLNRYGREDYEELYECKTMDNYRANEVAFDAGKTQVVPVYGRNKDIKIELRSTHPSPATLHSMEWEGEYSQTYYKRV